MATPERGVEWHGGMIGRLMVGGMVWDRYHNCVMLHCTIPRYPITR